MNFDDETLWQELLLALRALLAAPLLMLVYRRYSPRRTAILGWVAGRGD